ncbi:MAG: hypothetical protein RLZZ612_2094 [Pseudomonadota bacterium]
MQIRQCVLPQSDWPLTRPAAFASFDAHLVLVFASLEALQSLDESRFDTVRAWQGQAQWVGCSTAGEISGQGVSDGSIVLTALRFDTPAFRVVRTPLADMGDSQAAGQRLAAQLQAPDLRHVLVLGQGAHINGSALVQGLVAHLPPQVLVTGGLAGDGGRFTGARVLGPTGVSGQDIVAIGFDGPTWHITHGSLGGWQAFGPIRSITRSEGNVLYSLDHEPALSIYKRYLGDYAAQLPASGLLFPWSVLSTQADQPGVTRTILGINEDDGSLILAGDVPQGGHMQLMRASVDALVDAAEDAAQAAGEGQASDQARLALLVSCVGRKLVMGGRVDEEVEAVADVLGQHTTLTGFYSNGEISPHIHTMDCKLHNQTMTITVLGETTAAAA